MVIRDAVAAAGLSCSDDVLERAEAIWRRTEFLNMFDATHVVGAFDDEYVSSFRLAGISGTAVCVSKRHHTFEETVRAFLSWNEAVEKRSDVLLRVLTVDDLNRARQTNRLGVIWALDRVPLIRAIEPAYILSFRDHEHALRLLYDLGLRMSHLVYYGGTAIGDGSGEARDAGLTDLGREVVRTMNRLGITVDLAHASRRTCLDALEVSEKPCLLSHGGCKALTAHPRCVDDDVIRALAQAGGVFGLDALPEHISLASRTGSYVQPPLEDWLRHLDHVVELVGVDHVGFGPDSGSPTLFEDTAYLAMIRGAFTAFYSVPRPNDEHGKVKGLGNPRHWPILFAALVARGYGEEDIAKIMGGNFRRVLKATWH